MQIVENIAEHAKEFATQKHSTQKRKFTGQPYITHPMGVAKRVIGFTSDPEIIAAAYLHDVVEDTPTTLEDILNVFGIRVKNFVNELTSDKAQTKEKGKEIYLTEKINHMSVEARLVKFADREDNVSDLDKSPSDFTAKYAHETEYILTHLSFKPDPNEQAMIDSIWLKIQPYLK